MISKSYSAKYFEWIPDSVSSVRRHPTNSKTHISIMTIQFPGKKEGIMYRNSRDFF